MKKKLLVGLLIVMVLLFYLLFSFKIRQKEVINSEPLLEFLEQSEINADDIEKITYIRYTEGGDNEVIYTDKDDIKSIYNRVKNIKVGKETNRACEDNTTVYIFNIKNGTNLKVEIECDWVVINNKRYEIVKD